MEPLTILKTNPYQRIAVQMTSWKKYLLSQIDYIRQAPTTSCLLSTAMVSGPNVTTPPVQDVKTETNVTFACDSNQSKPHISIREERPYGKQTSSAHLNPFVPQFFTSVIPAGEPPARIIPDARLNFPGSDSSTHSASAGEELIQRLADLIAQRQDRESLPRPEPEVFTGNPLRYPIWKKSFETFIERKTKDPSERLYYMGRYTTGAANEAVSGLLALDNDDAYQKAKKSRFGDPLMVADAFRRKINEWPKIWSNDGQGLRKFSDFLEHCNTAMNTICYLNVLNDPEENQKILKKLPNYIASRWSRVVDHWITEEEADEHGTEERVRTVKSPAKVGYPPFAEFCRFMKKEARISCNPVTSPQALKGEEKGGGWRIGFIEFPCVTCGLCKLIITFVRTNCLFRLCFGAS